MSSTNHQKQIITLDYPVQLADRQLTEVVIRRMTVGDMMECPVTGAGDFAGEIRLMSRLTGLGVEDLRNLDFADYGKLQAALVRFCGLTPGQQS